jgi:hypothetical protein
LAWIFFCLVLAFIMLRIHSAICKCSYNISNTSYLKSHPPSFSFISLPPIPGSLNRSHLFLNITVNCFV